MTVASTFSLWHSASSRGHLSSGTARTIRSWASLIQISVYESPSYLSGAFSSQTSAPISAPISPTALEKPPAPQSVTAVIQPFVAGRQQHVEHHLLGDRVADLHRAAADLLAFVRQLGAGKRRPVNAVAARAAADGHDQIARLRLP